jgi:hypothetical protein
MNIRWQRRMQSNIYDEMTKEKKREEKRRSSVLYDAPLAVKLKTE